MRRFVWLVLFTCTLFAVLGPLLRDDPTRGEARAIAAAAPQSTNASPAEADATPRQAAPTRGHALRLVDAVDRTPIANACVRHADADRPVWRTGASDDDGTLVLPPAATHALAITAAGYAPCATLLGCDGSDARTLPLHRGAALELRFVDTNGAGIAGVRVRLVPPLASGRAWDRRWRADSALAAWGDELATLDPANLHDRLANGLALPGGRRALAACDGMRASFTESTTDAGGRVYFANLPPAPDWRFGVVSAHLATLQPPHETTPLRADPNGIRVHSGPTVQALSGAIALGAGATFVSTNRVDRGASLSGRFAAGAHVLRPQVKLYACTFQTGPGGRGSALDVSPEAFTVAADGDSFRFEPVRPGRKVVRAYWCTSVTDFTFATAVVDVRDGEQIDLGTIHAGPGAVGARIDLRDDELRLVTPKPLLVGDSPQAIVNVSAWTRPGELPGSVFEAIAVPLGNEVMLRGLPDGTLRLRAARGVGWPDPVPTEPHVRDADVAECVLPRAEPLAVTMPVEQRLPRTLLLAATGAPLAGVRLWLLASDRAPERIDVDGDAARAPVTLQVRRGRGAVFAHEPEDRAGARCGWLDVDWTATAAATLTLATGASVHGRCVSAAGRPLAKAVLAWTPTTWKQPGGGAFRTVCDADGAFVLHGLPPHVEMRGTRSGTDFRTPGSGEQALVRWTVAPRR